MSFSKSGNVITQANEAGKSITAVADGGSNELDLTVASHGYSAGDLVVVTGTTSYNGTYIVSSSVDANTVAIPDRDIDGNQNAFGSTETGTVARGDKDLSGMTGLTGVNKTVIGTGDRARVSYDLANPMYLVIQGSLMHDTDKEVVVFSNNVAGSSDQSIVTVNNGGSYYYGLKINGLPSTQSGIEMNVDPNPWWCSAINGDLGASIVVTGSTSLFNMYGGLISGAITTSYRNGAAINLYDGKYVIRDEGITNGTNWLIRYLDASYNIQKHSIKGGSLSIGSGTAGSTFSISRPESGGVAYWFQHLSSTPVRIKDYIVGNGYDVGVAIYQNVNVPHVSISENSDAGTNVDVRGGETNPSLYAQNAGIHIFVREITVNLVSDAGAVDGRIYIKDTNNGQRKNLNSVDDTADKIYEATMASGSISSWTKTGGGSLSYVNDNEVILGIVNVERNNSNSRGISNQGIYRKDLRGKNDIEGEDLFDIDYASYNFELKSFERSLSGSGVFSLDEKMFTDEFITETTKATVDAYSELETPEKFYDRAKAHLYDNYAGESSTIVNRSGSTIDAGSYNVKIDATAGSAFAFAGSTITIKATTFTGAINTTGILTLANGSIINGSFTSISIDFATAGTYNLQNSTFSGTLTVSNSSGGAVTVKVLPGTTVVNNGPNITVDDTETGLVTAPNIIDGSRYQVYNVTQTNEISNGLVSGGSGLSLSVILGAGQDALSGDTIRLRVTYQSGTSAKNELESTALITSAGVTFLDSQTDNEVYNSYGIDGSTITQFSADYVADEVDITVASNFSGKNFYSWWVYNETTAQGIDEFFGILTALDEANLRINSSLLNVFIDNNTSTNIWQTDNIRIFREDGNYPVKNPATTGGGGIDIVWRNQIFIAETGVSGLTPSESSALLAIPTNPLLTNDSRVDNLDASISSRLDAASYTAPDNAGITANGNAIAALNDVSEAEVKAQADQALTDYGTDTKTNVKPSVSI